MGGKPVSYFTSVVERLNSGLQKTNQVSGDGGTIQLEEVSFRYVFFFFAFIIFYEVVRVVGQFIGHELTFSSKKGLFLLI